VKRLPQPGKRQWRSRWWSARRKAGEIVRVRAPTSSRRPSGSWQSHAADLLDQLRRNFSANLTAGRDLRGGFGERQAARTLNKRQVGALGDPANRDAILRIRKWLDPEGTSDDDLAFHAAQTLLKIDATDPEIVAACIDAEARDAVIEAFDHHD
jgi:hypothetical protein